MAFDPQAADLALAALFAGWAMNDEVQRRLAADGYDDARFADGVLIQHLVDGPRTPTELAARLGVTQQAASKAVADLERRGYVARTRHPDDARATLIALSARGRAVVEAARAHRAELTREVAEALGPERAEAARTALLDVVARLGAEGAVRARRVRPPL